MISATKNSRVHQLALDYSFWPKVMFLAEAEHEGFSDVEIVTSKSYRKDLAISYAFDQGYDIDHVEKAADMLISQIDIEQFIEVQEDKVLIVLNVNEIDDKAINKALLMLMQVPEFTIGTRIMFDDKPYSSIRFKSHSSSNT